MLLFYGVLLRREFVFDKERMQEALASEFVQLPKNLSSEEKRKFLSGVQLDILVQKAIAEIDGMSDEKFEQELIKAGFEKV